MSTLEKGASLTLQEFPIPSYEAWRAEAEATLAGAPFDKKLVTQTYEGIAIQPIYRREDLAGIPYLGTEPGQAPYLRGTRGDNMWDVAQEIPYGLPDIYNQALRNDLERGQTAINITLDQATRHGIDPDEAMAGEAALCGVSIVTQEDFEDLLGGVDLWRVPLFLEGGSGALPLFALLVAHLGKHGRTDALRGALEYDPLAELVADGSLPHSLDTAFKQMALVTKWAARNTPYFTTIGVQTHVYHNAGATASQELAFALATGVEYLRQMEKQDIRPEDAAAQMRFGFSISTDFFMAIAKFRAARLLWSRVVTASGGYAKAARMKIHARTSIWNKSRLDPYVNMLRNTTEAFAAVAGGCDSMHVAAFDEVVRPPDEFSRRVARNTQIILRDECHFEHVIDPAGGSYYVETLTKQLADKAWTIFQEIETAGGMAKALKDGVPQKMVNTVAAKKAEAVAQRRNSVIGVNVYANPKETPLDTCDLEFVTRQKKRAIYASNHRLSPGQAAQTAVLARLGEILSTEPGNIFDTAVAAALKGATLGELSRVIRAGDEEKAAVEKLPSRRASEPFEKLRAAVEAAGKSRVFLANMGPLRQHKARADFSTSFFQAGGFAIEENTGFQTVSQAADAALKSKARVVIICSTDETYPEIVPALAGLLKASEPKTLVVVAGFPKDHIETFKAAGVDEFIHIRANCYEVLRGIALKLGIQL